MLGAAVGHVAVVDVRAANDRDAIVGNRELLVVAQQITPAVSRVEHANLAAAFVEGGVSALLAMDRTTLTANLKPLQRRGLLEVTVDGADKRGRRLRLTSAGRALLAAALPVWEELTRRSSATLPGPTPKVCAAICGCFPATGRCALLAPGRLARPGRGASPRRPSGSDRARSRSTAA